MPKLKQQGELKYLHISNKISSAKIALQGAHIFDFQVKRQKPLLWLSDSSNFAKGKAIRGGIPICWPWFGASKTNSHLPNHGFARTSLWTHIKTENISDTKTKVILELSSSPESLQIWPYLFELRLEIIISDYLKVSLITKNKDTKAFHITNALHSYLSVNDIHQVSVDGLNKKYYYNKVDNSVENVQEGKLFFTGEIDRIYTGISSTLNIRDTDRNIKIKTEGSEVVVIWNPAEKLAAKMPDLSDYKTMLCIESANALDDIPLIHPNKTHKLTTIISQANLTPIRVI